jgi:hypothetical protein
MQGVSGEGVSTETAFIAFDGTDIASDRMGNLFLTQENTTVRRIDASGTIATIASSLGIRRIASGLTRAIAPRIAADGAGNLFVAEVSETTWRIRKVAKDGSISTAMQLRRPYQCADAATVAQPRPSARRLFVSSDPSGNVFFAEEASSLVRKRTLSGEVSVVAGTGTMGFIGDGGKATAAQLGAVSALAVDAKGNLFIGEANAPRVRKVAPDGVISTIAGTGRFEAAGDGGPAAAASMCAPTGLAADGLGNLFVSSGIGGEMTPAARGQQAGVTNRWIADSYAVRKIDSSGVISTVAGTGSASPRGIAGNATPKGQPAAERGFWARSIAADGAGNLYVMTDWGVGKIDPAGALTTLLERRLTAPGELTRSGAPRPGTATLSTDLTADRDGNVFLADATTGLIEKITPDGTVRVVAGNGRKGLDFGIDVPARASSLALVSSEFAAGSAIAVDGAGNLFAGEVGTSGGATVQRIRIIDANGRISTIFDSDSRVKISGQVTSTVPRADSVTRNFDGSLAQAATEARLYVVSRDGRNSAVTRNQAGRVSLEAPANGRFEIRLAPGSYELFAAVADIHGWDLAPPGGGVNPLAFGRATFEATGDQSDVAITVHAGVDLKGRVTLDGKAAAPAGVRIFLRPDANAATMEPYQTVGRFSPAIGADGSFTFPALPEARYRIEVTSALRLSIADLRLDGRSLADNLIDIRATAPGILEIILETTAGR